MRVRENVIFILITHMYIQEHLYIHTHNIYVGKAIEITATTEFINVVKTPMEKIMEQESEPKYNINTSDQEVKDEDPNTLAVSIS